MYSILYLFLLIKLIYFSIIIFLSKYGYFEQLYTLTSKVEEHGEMTRLHLNKLVFLLFIYVYYADYFHRQANTRKTQYNWFTLGHRLWHQLTIKHTLGVGTVFFMLVQQTTNTENYPLSHEPHIPHLDRLLYIVIEVLVFCAGGGGGGGGGPLYVTTEHSYRRHHVL